jgi:hypothetical protein
MPQSLEEIQLALMDGYIPLSDGRMYPPKEVVAEIDAAYGERIGMPSNWEEIWENTVNQEKSLEKLKEKETAER